MKLQLDEADLTKLGRAAIATQTEEVEEASLPGVPVGFVPTPTSQYRTHRKLLSATVQPGKPKVGAPTPIPLSVPGARVLMWKQDPSVAEIGIRKTFVPGLFFLGPRDFRIVTQGVTPVPPTLSEIHCHAQH